MTKVWDKSTAATEDMVIRPGADQNPRFSSPNGRPNNRWTIFTKVPCLDDWTASGLRCQIVHRRSQKMLDIKLGGQCWRFNSNVHDHKPGNDENQWSVVGVVGWLHVETDGHWSLNAGH